MHDPSDKDYMEWSEIAADELGRIIATREGVEIETMQDDWPDADDEYPR